MEHNPAIAAGWNFASCAKSYQDSILERCSLLTVLAHSLHWNNAYFGSEKCQEAKEFREFFVL
jgi:hypothetical protein